MNSSKGLDPYVSTVIVTHNSEHYLPKCMASLETQIPHQIIIVDSHSKDPSYLKPYEKIAKVIYSKENLGFCKANNLGYQSINPKSKYVLFLNPDAFLSAKFLEEAIAYMDNNQNSRVGALSPPLYGYDFVNDVPTGLYDSTGVFVTWYGKWFDRGQGEKIDNKYVKIEEVPALSGALLFCRNAALSQFQEIFKSSFYMYKEDIELSQRLKKAGWTLIYNPHLAAFHGRGWSKNRKLMSRQSRLLSAWNEIQVNSGSILRLPYSLAKYTAVKLLDI